MRVTEEIIESRIAYLNSLIVGKGFYLSAANNGYCLRDRDHQQINVEGYINKTELLDAINNIIIGYRLKEGN